ncbi:MAG: outer membrane beta-barrel protein [Nitrospirota bacterium]|nr:outer membrane beta-barrel protein [Nitrospirota bacterium]
MISVRSRIGIGLGICAMVSLLGSNPVSAAEDAAESLWKTMGFKIYGAVDASYTQNFNNPNTNVNSLRIFDTQANSFSPNLAQVVLERPARAGGSAMDRVGFRTRLSFGSNARFSRARTNFQPGVADNEVDPQELYAEYLAPIGNGLLLQAGKMHTLIGYEVINSWENPNFSRTFMFGLAQAFTETGIRATYQFNPMVTATVGLINGWDNIEDNNRGKTVVWLVALTPHERFGVNFFGSYGAEQTNSPGVGPATPAAPGADPSAKRLVAGAIITAKVTDSDTIILEPYYGNESNASGARLAAGHSPNARWNGLGAYHIHDFNDEWSTRIRGEIFEDAGGARTCAGAVNFQGGTNTCFGTPVTVPATFGGGLAQTLWEVTGTLQYKPAPALITRVEFRYDKSDKSVFLQGSEASNNQQTLSFQVVYLF